MAEDDGSHSKVFGLWSRPRRGGEVGGDRKEHTMALLAELEPEECVALLEAGVVGRVAVATPEGPHIVPVNYTVVDGGVLVTTSPYSLLGTYGRGAVVAFEVDGFDSGSREGWSVVVRGRADPVDPPSRGRLGADLVPTPWADGVRPLLLRIACSDLSGRRLFT